MQTTQSNRFILSDRYVFSPKPIIFISISTINTNVEIELIFSWKKDSESEIGKRSNERVIVFINMQMFMSLEKYLFMQILWKKE